MKILLFGASGRTGMQFIPMALEKGHEVTAFVRNPQKVIVTHPHLRLLKGDILDYEQVSQAVRGQDVVISALGSDTLKKSTVGSQATRHILRAMQQQQVARLVFLSSLGVGESKDQVKFLFKWLLVPLLLRHIMADKEVQERLVKDSALQWSIVRPSGLNNKRATGTYQVGLTSLDGLRGTISRADVARFMLEIVEQNHYLRQAVGISD